MTNHKIKIRPAVKLRVTLRVLRVPSVRSVRVLLIFLFFLLSALSLSAQTAEELDILLGTKEVSAAMGARFVLGAAGLIPPELHGAQAEAAAYKAAFSKGWIETKANDALTLRDTAFLVMNVFDLKGGIFYSFFKNPRYAYREMVYRKLIQGRADPGMTVSGQRLLQILGRSLNYSGDSELSGEEASN